MSKWGRFKLSGSTMPRHLLLFLCIGCSLLAQVARAEPSSARASVEAGGWVATDLGNLGRSRVTVADINDRGQVVGGAETRHGESRGFVWQNGSMKIGRAHV